MYTVAIQGNVWGLVINCIAHLYWCAYIVKPTKSRLISTVTLEILFPYEKHLKVNDKQKKILV